MHLAIVGSGLSGLTAGACLSKAGCKTTVYEQYHEPGGVTASFIREGYKWDLGQLLIEGLGPDEPLGLILSELGIASNIQIKKDDRGYVFPDFAIEQPEKFEGIKWRFEKLKSIFPNEAKGLENYWRDYVRFTRLLTYARRINTTTGISKQVNKFHLYLALSPFLTRIKWDAQRLMDSYFTSRELQCVFISILADFFTSPNQFPGLGVYGLNAEAVFDKRMPKEIARNAETLYHYSFLGGISSLVSTLVEGIEENSGEVILNSPVTSIKIEDNRVVGVVTEGNILHPADIVIASGGARETFLKLVGEGFLPGEFSEKVKKLPLMDSVFMVHLGIDFDPSPWVHGAVTYYYGTYDIEGGINEAHQGVYHQGASGFVIHVPSLHSPEMAPEGHHAMTIYTICPDRLNDGSWESKKEEYANAIINYAERHIPNLSKHVCTRYILTPEDFRNRTHLDHHAFGGIAPLINIQRIPHRTPIRNLWFVGAQSESGSGVNNVIPGAYKTARLIIKENSLK